MNERGYLGPVQEALDEQQLAGHGWLVSGLLEAYALLADPALLSMARRMVDGLFMQVRGKMADYPSNPADRIVAGEAAGTHVTTLAGWTISSDTGCVFIALEGLVKAHAIFQRAHEKELIDEMLASFRAMNLVGLSAQLHASLTATRQMLAYHDMERDAAKILKMMQKKKAGKVLESMKPESSAAILLLGNGN